MFLRLLAVQLDIESRRHIAIKTLVREDEAGSGMSIGVLTHHFPTRAQFIVLFSLTVATQCRQVTNPTVLIPT